MDVTMTAAFLAAIGLLYLTAGYIGFGPTSFLQETSKDIFFNKLENTTKKSLVPKVLLIAVLGTAWLAIMFYFISHYNDSFRIVNRIVTFIPIFHIVHHLVTRFSKIDTVKVTGGVAFLITVIIDALLQYYDTTAVQNIGSVFIALYILVILRSIKLKTFLIFGAGIMIFDFVAVFYTQQMIDVAKATQGIPGGSVVVPTSADSESVSAISTGLGDIIIPGMLAMIAFRQSQQFGGVSLWVCTFLGYALGSVVTEYVLFNTNFPQPATIYLIPGVTLGYFAAVLYKRLTWKQVREI